ncbi:uncharacterized protein LOC144477793, partial [Augochlora pura]
LVNAGLNIIGHLAFAVKCQFTFVAVTVLLEVFTCVLPADSLIEASEGGIRSVYNVKWYERDLSVQKMVYRMMMRQKPIVVSFIYVVPQLSLDYYCSYIANAFSMFTTLRFLLSDPEEITSSDIANATCCNN